MKTFRALMMILLLVTIASAPFATATPAAAQDNSELQVWYYVGDQNQLGRVEYRDAAGNVLAAYSLASDSMYAPSQVGGMLSSYAMDAIPIFSPYTGLVTLYATNPTPEDTTGNVAYAISNAALSPVNTYAYSITKMNLQDQTPSENQVFLAAPGQNYDSVLLQTTSDPWMALQPLGWDSTGTKLLLHDMPQGIGGYILFWTYQNVQVYDIGSGMTTLIGNIDGYAKDLTYTATMQYNDSGITGIQVTNLTTGQATTYPLPALPEQTPTGGGAVFSPNNTKVAYQVARQNPETEKYYTIVVDLTTGQSRVAFEDEAVDYEPRYGDISGWLDETQLVIGSTWHSASVVIDTNSGTTLGEISGAFLGYADGITSNSGFAPSGIAYTQCPNAPVSRLSANTRGRVTYTDGTMTNVRYWAGLDADLTGQMAEGSTFTVLNGPTCVDGYAWWNLQFDSGLSGYVAEGTPSEYYLEPWQ